MSYQRFDLLGALAAQEEPLATVATDATLSDVSHDCVATVATVATSSFGLIGAGDPRRAISKTTLSRAIHDAEDWQAYFEERAAIREYAGGFSRPEAELLALEETIKEKLSGQPDMTSDLLFRVRAIAR